MKFNKNNLQMVSLFIATFSIIFTIFSVMFESESLYLKSEFVLILTTIIVFIIFALYFLLIIRRINPKQFIYISYSDLDREIAQSVSQTLSNQFEILSKYRFEIRTADSIPFGEDMYITMQEYTRTSDIIIVIVSEHYIDSDWCSKEFKSFVNMNKRIIPVVMNSYGDLSRLPVDISNIKALSLYNCSSKKDFENQLLRLAKDLIRQRKD